MGKTANKDKQLTFRAELGQVEELEELAQLEEMSLAQLVRTLLRVGVQLREKHGSLHALKSAAGTKALGPTSHTSESVRHATVEAMLADGRITEEESEALLGGRQKEKSTHKRNRLKASK